MKAQNILAFPIGSARSVDRMAPAASGSAFDWLASAALIVLLVPLFLYRDMALPVAVPLSLLIALISRHVFRLILAPGGSDVFFPTTLIVGYFAIDFAARAFYLSTVQFFPRIGVNPYDDYIPAALWCACVGYVAFLCGIRSGSAKRWVRHLPVVTQQWSSTFPTVRLLLLILVGLGSLVYLFKMGVVVGNYSNVSFQRNPPPGLIVLLENLIDLSFAAICVILIAPAKKSNRVFAWPLLGITLGILCIKIAVSGGKVALIQPLLEAVLVVHYAKRRFRVWELVAIGIPALMLTFGIINFYRFVVVGHHGSPKSLADVISRVSSASDLLTSKHGTSGQPPALEQMVDRNAGTDALAIIMKYTPQPFPYAVGKPWLQIPLTFIPRQIWKNKPINIPSAEFESTYLGLSTHFNGFSSIHLIGDLYRNFSFVGVLGGMFLVGVLLRLFYLFCSPSRENRVGVFLYAALFPEIIHSFESDAGYGFINVSRIAALAIVVAIFLGARFQNIRRLRLIQESLVADASRRPAAQISQ